MESIVTTDVRAWEENHYLIRPGLLGMGEPGKAVEEFDRVLEVERDHQNAAIYKKMCTYFSV